MTQVRSGRREPHYALAGAVLLTVILVLVIVALASFRGSFDTARSLRVVSDRAGLVMQSGAKVKMNGVTIGSVSTVTTDGHLTALDLRVDPADFSRIPEGTVAEIRSSTAFGAKYVALVVPDDPGGRTVVDGQTIAATNVPTEVNTLFENLQGVMETVDPAKLNAALSAVAGGLRQRGAVLAETIDDSDAVLRGINPMWPQISRDTRLAGAVADTYGDAAQSILALLDNATVTAGTVVDRQDGLDGLLASAVGLGNTGAHVLRVNGPAFVNASRLLVPTTALLAEYSPEYKCIADQATYNLKYGMGRFGGNTTGYSMDLDVALLLGDNAYRYPDNLPEIGAEGGPRGAPGCYSQITRTNYPAPYLVMDTGASNADATSLAPGTPIFMQYLVAQITGGGSR